MKEGLDMKFLIPIALLFSFLSAVAQDPLVSTPRRPGRPAAGKTAASPTSVVAPKPEPNRPATTYQVIDKIIDRERSLIQFLSNRTPLVETYLQEFAPDAKLGSVPKQDHYFLGRFDMGPTIERRNYLASSLEETLLGGMTRLFRIQYQPMGFAWMLFVDRQNLDRNHYNFKYVRREFLGDVRCLVFDVTPNPGAGKELFKGRIWVEDENYNIVRLNGTYFPRPRNAQYFHMDSWRLNLVPGYWVPAYIYSEEGDFSSGSREKLSFKAQSRIWGYGLVGEKREGELTDLNVDAVKDESVGAQDASPLEAERAWQQQAEDNVIGRLEQAGLLAPPGDVDKVLETVVNNLVATNNLEFARPVHVRVMLTSPLETCSVGDTIIISRGLIDTLPDEASLAAILSHELAHIVLGHNLGSKYAFNDRMLFSDESTYQNLGFRPGPEDEAAADVKALELLEKSPYAQKLGSAGLYLKQLQARAPSLAALMTAHLGNSLGNGKGQITRLAALMPSAPALDDGKLNQIAALPLGGRVKLDPWGDGVEMIKAAPVTISTARDKMPFEVTPFFPRLTRLTNAAEKAASSPTAAENAAPGHR